MALQQAHLPVPPAETNDRVRSFYRLHASIYDQTRWAFLFGRQEVVKTLELRPGHCVLEIGCGTGLNFALLRSAVGDDGLVVGVDYSESMLARARRRIDRNGWSNVAAHPAAATPLDLEFRFDAVLFCYSLAMIKPWEQALERSVRLLKKGGTLAVLDFGEFRAWPWPAGSIIRGWLGLNHVDTRRPITDRMTALLADVRSHRRLGGYYFIAAGCAC
jgi:ubiquinone/menaquinone biosynthesis C-methylase UbiE